MQTLPGFRDFLPAACAQRNYIFAKWREVARRYGFVEWDGPMLEPTGLYRKKSGDEIVRQLFNFTDKGDREVALRPELTPTLARVVAAHERSFRKPLKWFAIPQCFRYEKQQRGRLREHFQLNCDLIGDASPAADAELIALAIDLVRGFGFTANDVVVRVSDRGFWIDFLKQHDVPPARFEEILQTIDKSEREPREKTAEKLGALADPIFAAFDHGGESAKLSAIMQDLRARGLEDFAKIDLRIVRGLAYYTGVVFEVFDRGGKFRAIAGGGRYDNLIAQLSDGAASLPAVGFALGDVVLGEMIQANATTKAQMEAALKNEGSAEVFCVIAKEERRGDALALVQQLREAGWRTDYPIASAKIPKQFQAAEQIGARYAVLLGDEWPQVALKNLATGEQTLVARAELLAHLAR
ncbi:MAG: histidine--tRNA ligase [Verrucomicrobiota bacterium]|nr:histidine--tRNA ligase [Verrucomicrobiota bacterium]